MWTRNYQNLLNTIISCGNVGQKTALGTSGTTFGDAYCWNFRAPNGNVYDIVTLNEYADYGNEVATAFLIRNASGTYTSSIQMQTTPTDYCSSSNNTLFVGFGSSGEAATFEDYKLHSHITSGYSTLSRTATPTLNADGTVTINYKIIISATADLTIQEIGIFKTINYLAHTSSSNDREAYYALINRIVLDEPVSVATNQTSTITFSITTPKITLS